MTTPKTTPRRLSTALAVLALALLAAPAAFGQKVLHQGTWTAKGYEIEGTWKIVEEGGRAYVALDADFSTKQAPDLKIFLSPLALSEIRNSNATKGALRVGALTSPKGAQKLEIPAGTDLGRYKTLVLHCEKYTKLWGGSALR